MVHEKKLGHPRGNSKFFVSHLLARSNVNFYGNYNLYLITPVVRVWSSPNCQKGIIKQILNLFGYIVNAKNNVDGMIKVLTTVWKVAFNPDMPTKYFSRHFFGLMR